VLPDAVELVIMVADVLETGVLEVLVKAACALEDVVLLVELVTPCVKSVALGAGAKEDVVFDIEFVLLCIQVVLADVVEFASVED